MVVLAPLLEQQLVVIAGKIVVQLGEDLEDHMPLVRDKSELVLVGLQDVEIWMVASRCAEEAATSL